jgi:hypothetical protein
MYLLYLKESYDDLSQKDVESLSGRSLSSANSMLLIHCCRKALLLFYSVKLIVDFVSYS